MQSVNSCALVVTQVVTLQYSATFPFSASLNYNTLTSCIYFCIEILSYQDIVFESMITSEDYSEDKIKFQSTCTLVTSIQLAKLCGKFSIIDLLCAEFLVTQIMLTEIAMQTEDL